jgi:hypothetical protein
MPQPPRPPWTPPTHGPGDDERRRRCRQLLDELERLCPELVPAPPRRPGELADPVTLRGDALGGLVRRALAPEGDEPVVVWRDADAEVALHVRRTRVEVRDGLVAVALLVECQETGGPVEVVVPFAVGSEERPAGMIAATERRPRGPAVLVDRWGEALVAAAWEALLDIASVAAARAGEDTDGEPLRAGALLARRDALAIIPQARHEFEREAGS